MTLALPAPRARHAPVLRRPGERLASERWGRLLFGLLLGSAVVAAAAGPVPALLAATTLALAVAALGVWYPVPGFLAIGVLCALDAAAGPVLQSLGWWRWNTINYALLVAALLCTPFLLRVTDLATRCLTALLLLSIVLLAPSADRAAGAQLILELLAYWGILAYLIRAPSAAAAWYWFGVGAGTAGALAGAAFVLGAGPAAWAVNPNVWSQAPLTGLFAVCLALARLGQGRRGRVPLYVLAAVDAAWVFLSASRGSMSLALVCLAYLVTTAGGLRRAVTVALGGLLLTSALVSRFPVLGAAAVARVELLLDRDASMRVRTSGRDELLRGGLRLAREHPAGLGTGAFAGAWTGVAVAGSGLRFRRGEASVAHSAWVRVLVETGVAGALLLAGFVLAIAGSALLQRNGATRAIGLLAATVVALGFASTDVHSKGLWLLAAGAIVLLHRRRVPARRRARPGE